MRPGDWITRRQELFLGLIGCDGRAGKSVERVGAELRGQLMAAEQNIRLFMAIKAVVNTATDAVALDMPGGGDLLAGANLRLDAFITLFNLHLEELKEERGSWQSAETRLEKALKMLPAINVDGLRPSPDSLTQLKAKILDDARGESWLQTKVRSLVCEDGFTFGELMN